MHLGRTPTEQADLVSKRAQQLAHLLRQRLPGEIQRVRILQYGSIPVALISRGAPEKSFERFQRELPRIALIAYITLQDSGRKDFSPGTILERSQHRRRVLESALCEKDAHFRIGIHARLQFPEQLQDIAIAINDRTIALFDIRNGARELLCCGRLKGAGAPRNEIPGRTADSAIGCDGAKQHSSKIRIPERTI